MLGGLGLPELLIIAFVVVMLFGAKRIPEIMGGIGKGIKTFKKTMETDETPAPKPPETSQSAPAETPKEEKAETS